MPYGGGAGGGSVAGVMHTSEASPPGAGLGVEGDFHLQRDTGKIVGPKILGYSNYKSATDGVKLGGANLAGRRWALKFEVLADIDVAKINVAYNDASAVTDAEVFLLDEAFNVLGKTDVFTTSVDEELTNEHPLLAPVTLEAGNAYWIGNYSVSTTYGCIATVNGTNEWPDDTKINECLDSPNAAKWLNTSASFKDATDVEYTNTDPVFWWFALLEDAGATWTGADEFWLNTSAPA